MPYRKGGPETGDCILAGFLPVQTGSRMAMGMGPLSNPPVMAFPRPIPDDLLWDSAEMDAPTQLLSWSGGRPLRGGAAYD